MTAPADLVLTDAAVHTLAEPDRTHEAVAVRDGRIVRVGDAYDLDMLVGADTRRVALDGRVVLPGFVDAHTHLPVVGRREVHADLGGATSREAALDALRDRAAEVDPDEWVLGYGYDESAWGETAYLTGNDLDAVHEGPVAAFREDLHAVSVNAAALDRLDLPDEGVERADGTPTGVLVEAAATAVREQLRPDRAEARRLVAAGQAVAHARGVTAVHDMVRGPAAPRAYRDLERAGELTLRVQLYYWRDHLDAVEEVGLATGAGDRVRFGGIKTFSDGSIGARTARLADPYADAPDERGEWVVDPDALGALVDRVDDLDLRPAVHAIGDDAVDAALDAFAAADEPGADRYRVEHAELADDAAVERMADLGVVASVQPNFLKWAGEGGLYEARLGDRRTRSNRLRDLLDAGVPLAFGSDCMPLDPLFGVHHAVNAPEPAQRLDVTEALRAYTRGAAYAGFDEDRMGTVEPGRLGDLVVLDDSPWGRPESIRDVDVAMTVVGGEVVYDALDD
ncbi:MAG: amidohydrolase [Haloferacaceae archaeon]